MKRKRLQLLIKRVLDFMIAITALIVLSPLMLLLAGLIRANMGKHVLFRHRRPGLHEKIFTLYKFRTMTNDTDDNGDLLSNEERLTQVGRTIRSLSLDELPQLWNILKGDMSLVGPRPLLIEYVDRYSPRQRRRHEVKPGITGWAQINGRNAITWDEKFEYDIWYINNWSLILDLKIILITAYKIIKREGITPEDSEIMERFMGSGDVSVDSLPDKPVKNGR